MPEIESFRDNYNGYYYKDTSKDLFSILNMCSNIYKSDRYKTLSYNCLKTIEVNYNTKIMVNNLIKLFDK